MQAAKTTGAEGAKSEERQGCLEKDYRVVERYPLYEPYAYAVILEHVDTGAHKYCVDELRLTRKERRIFRRIVEALQWELKLPEEVEDPQKYLREEARRVVEKFRISLGEMPGVSWHKIMYYIERDVIGFGPIDPLMRDPYIEDISCNGVGVPVYVWHRKYESLPTNIVFTSHDELDEYVLRLAHISGKHISTAFPILDAILPGGHRLAATFKKEVSTKGSTFTIRKFREQPVTIAEMIRRNTLTAEMAAYLWIAMENKLTAMVMGVTGSGKTTTLNALATLFRPTIKVVTIEDTPELKIPLENWVQLVARPSYGVGTEKIGEVTLFDLVKVSLRYRPDVIIVGEVRGEEAYVLFQAIATGHGGLTTLHAESVEAAVKRLTSPPMNIPPGYIPLMNLAIIIKRVRIRTPENPQGRIERRITDLYEILDYGNYKRVARWDAFTDTFETFFQESEMLRRIGMQIGMTHEELLAELEKRAKVLQWMAEKGVNTVEEVAKIVQSYYSRPDEVYKRAEEELAKIARRRRRRKIGKRASA